MVRDSAPKARPLDIQPQPAEEFDRVIQAKAPALEQLEFVVKSLDKATGMPPIEIVENAVVPVMQRIDELIKAAQPRGFDLLGPALELGLGGGPIRAMVEDRGQQGAQDVGAGQRGR